MCCESIGCCEEYKWQVTLILDLRYVNNHLRSCKFKYEGFPAASELFQKDDWVFTFDLQAIPHFLDAHSS